MSSQPEKKFRVLVEAKIREEIEIDAMTYEEAVTKAKSMKKVGQAILEPTWVDTAECVEATGELSHEVIGECARCKTMMVDRKIPGQPWIYGSDPKNEHGGLVCYACLNNPVIPVEQVDEVIESNSWGPTTNPQEIMSWAMRIDWPVEQRSCWVDAIAERLAENKNMS